MILLRSALKIFAVMKRNGEEQSSRPYTMDKSSQKMALLLVSEDSVVNHNISKLVISFVNSSTPIIRMQESVISNSVSLIPFLQLFPSEEIV